MNRSIKEKSLTIENMINDSIELIPNFRIEIEKKNGKSLIYLYVFKGEYTPYYYKNKAYKRSDTSSLEVDRFELHRLSMQGLNINYEEQKSSKQDLVFLQLQNKIILKSN